MREFRYLWGQLDTEERETWLIELRGIHRTHTTKWSIYIITCTLVITDIIIVATPIEEFQHYIFALMGGYIMSLNIFAIKWIIDSSRHKRHA